MERRVIVIIFGMDTSNGLMRLTYGLQKTLQACLMNAQTNNRIACISKERKA
jgi:hypothetical protein